MPFSILLQFGFALEPCSAVRAPCELLRQDLDRRVPAELLVSRAVYCAHTPGAKFFTYLVMIQRPADHDECLLHADSR